VLLRELSGTLARAHLEVKRSLSSQDDPDLVLLTVKAYDTEVATRAIRKSIGSNGLVLSLQNGLGNIETLRRYLPAQELLAGTTTEAALQTGPGEVTHTGGGTTGIGEVSRVTSNGCGMIREFFRKAGFRTVASKNIEGVIWSKAIMNSAINPITALLRVPNGELLRIPYLRSIANAVVHEGTAVARAHGVSLNPAPRSMLLQVLALTRSNRSSMLQDVEAGKRTEVRQLNGWIASLAGRLGVDAPYNRLLSKLVLGLETYRSR